MEQQNRKSMINYSVRELSVILRLTGHQNEDRSQTLIYLMTQLLGKDKFAITVEFIVLRNL